MIWHIARIRREPMKMIRDYVWDRGIKLCGRFAEFYYLNVDVYVERGRQMPQESKNIACETI